MMQPEQLARLYNGFQSPPDAARFVDKDRREQQQQLRQQQMAGRGFAGANVGFHIELGEERQAEKQQQQQRRVVYDSSGRDHDWPSADDATGRTAGRPGDESFNGMVNRSHDVSGSHSDGSEDYEEEELDLEADGRDGVVGESERNNSSLGQDGVAAAAAAGFQRINSDPKASSGGQKFGMFPFFNSLAGGHENGGGRRVEAEGNGVSDSMFFNPLAGAGAAAEKRPGQENSVRHFLSDPISGILMEDAVIFPCGHSVGTAGYQRVQETNVCVVCMLPTSTISAAPNHALRAAVQAFKRDREFPIITSSRSAKRRREQDDDSGKVKGVQFPYSVSDRVLIKGNKRTPERFVGREAIITTQCLNGWYLVRTVDNGESVRLQYRSLQKVGE